MIERIRFTLWLVAACCGTAMVPVAVAQQVQLELKNDAWIAGSMVYVGDVARIQILPDAGGASAALADRIARLDLKQLSNQELLPSVSADIVHARLRVSGIAASDLHIGGAAACAIHQVSLNDVAEQLRESVVRHLSGQLNRAERDIQVTLDLSTSQLQDVLRLWSAQARIQPLNNADQMIGRRQIEIGILHNDQLKSSFRIPAQISVFADVQVASQPIARGEVVQHDHVYTLRQQFETSAALSQIPLAVVGEVAARPIRAQQVIQQIDLSNTPIANNAANNRQQPEIIRNRDLVTVTLTRGALKVTLAGAQALRGGRVGDVIPVRNESTGKTIMAQVVGAGEVTVKF